MLITFAIAVRQNREVQNQFVNCFLFSLPEFNPHVCVESAPTELRENCLPRQTNEIVLLVGYPGSGKSTLSQLFEVIIFSFVFFLTPGTRFKFWANLIIGVVLLRYFQSRRVYLIRSRVK